ncbi:MAG: sigma 54-interacting transcriptional regulator [Halanaerobiaceae bacterium]
MDALIQTIKDRCHECYACVRNCPVKALRVKDGQADVISDRCIHCGNCVRVCSQGAKEVEDNIDTVTRLLKGGGRIVAGLAPSFPSFNAELSLIEWYNILSALGFNEVYEVAWGARLIVEEYRRLLKQKQDMVISSPCPVIVNLICKYYPELNDKLAPVASPMMALQRYIKEIEGMDTKIVLIGPCQAKKGEFASVKNVYVMTFSEINDLIQQLQPGLGDLRETDSELFTGELNPAIGTGAESEENELEAVTSDARRLPLSGGLLKAVTGEYDIFPDGYLKVEGKDRVFELLNSIDRGEIRPEFVDILFCEGCINGVDLTHENYFKKEKAVYSFISETGQEGSILPDINYSLEIGRELDLRVDYEEESEDLPEPGEGEIWGILNQTGKYTEEDLLNCGACGYDSCREKAIAVYQGLAEVEMCLPYLLSEKRSEIKKEQELNRELDTLINSSYDGMLMVNSEGDIVRVNQSYISLLGISREELLKRNVIGLERNRIIYPSVSKLCFHEKREITIIQHTRDGHKLLTTGSPLLDNNGNVIRVVVNARSLKKLNELSGNLGEEEKLRQYLDQDSELDLQEGSGHIIYSSSIMKNILKLSRKVGETDSSVLITGESGVGKEVIARYIHEQNPDRESFIKINCAAIPDSLLESELFGYETGAFSGAKREGKQGLIEKADGGTLFLDEIGEMPGNMQAKLLQVIQEHRLTRIGGVNSIAVDFRLITATNKNLKEMVDNKEFREDLYYRLNVVPVFIPPLRERREDIMALIDYYLDVLNKKHGKNIKISEGSRELLYNYDWPGNVRELSNLLERLVVTAEEEEIGKTYLQNFIEFEQEETKNEVLVNNIIPLNDAVGQVEKKLLLLAREEGQTTYQMADMLGVNQSTIVRKLKKYFG